MRMSCLSDGHQGAPGGETRQRREGGTGRRRCRSDPLVRGLVPWSHSANLPTRQRYLYLVLDDWQRGYNTHRLGEDDFESNTSMDARPAECPLVRVQAQHAYTCSFTDHDSKILAMQPAGFSLSIPKTLEMTVYPLPKSRAVTGTSKLVHTSVGDRLVSFVFRYLEVLGPEPQPDDESSWSWTSVEPFPPFDSSHVSSYALHPDGRTIFMSVKDWSVRTTSLAKRNSTTTTMGIRGHQAAARQRLRTKGG
ncbi:uncharacterized protein [Miscanthus floridulus]|uniref:uncharacterized protein n=1 Tax=Miscanthus floridulus TaxID=154761 RepID=UPI00345985BB